MDSIFPQTETNNIINEPDPQLLAQLKSGANWFYWIAGLSLVNSAIYAFGGQISFILGLAVTQVIDALSDTAIAAGAPTALKAVAVVIDLVITAMFALFGYYAGKGLIWPFIVGIAFYILDGLVYLAGGDMFAAGFHAFALFFIIRGFLASRKLKQFSTPVGQAI